MADAKTARSARDRDDNGKSPLRLLLVEDSVVQRRFLRGALDAMTEFDVVGEARNGRDAVSMVEQLRPAAVLMDLDLPVMSGLETIERIMAIAPTPIVVYSALLDEKNSTRAMEALAAGAVDVVATPVWGEGGTRQSYTEELRRRLRVAARIKVITHPRARLNARVPQTPAASGAPGPSDPGRRASMASPPPAIEVPTRNVPTRLLAIGASTGGPQALAQVLGGLPKDFAPAVLVVQHMAEGFIPGLVQWLGTQCRLKVVQGTSGKRLTPGEVTVAPSGLNLLVRDHLRVVCEPAPERQFHVPGVDASFRSVAESVGAEAIGVLLTGMGRDGAAGLKAMRDGGAVTIGQDEETSAVYGMPAVAYEIGAVEHQLPLAHIAPFVVELVRSAP